jgi:hypothetical protein
MPIEEIVRSAIFIGRVRVGKTERVRYRGEFGQLAHLEPVDVIDGDSSATRISVLADSNVRCARDYYTRDQDMLVFLEPEESLLHTINYQYGHFQILGEVVKGWRDKNNRRCDRPYAEVREEIVRYLDAARKPPGQQPAPAPPPPVRPPSAQTQ